MDDAQRPIHCMYTLHVTRLLNGRPLHCVYSQGIDATFMQLHTVTAFSIQKQIVSLSGIETLDTTKSLYRFQCLWRRWWAWRRAARAIATPRYLRAREHDGRNLRWELERRVMHHLR